MNEKQKINIFMFEKIRQQVLKFLQCFDQFIYRHYQTNINLDFYFVFACIFVFFICSDLDENFKNKTQFLSISNFYSCYCYLK